MNPEQIADAERVPGAERVFDELLAAIRKDDIDAFAHACGAQPGAKQIQGAVNFLQATREHCGEYLGRRCLGPPLKNPDKGYVWMVDSQRDRSVVMLRINDAHKITELVWRAIEREIPGWRRAGMAPTHTNPPSGLEFRPTTEDDLDSLTRISQRTLAEWYKKDHYEKCDVKQREALARGAYYTIRFEDRIVGAVDGSVWDDVSRVIGGIFVDADVQGRGIGSAAVDFVQRRYPDTPIWWVSTSSMSPTNRHFYQKAGFIKVKDWQDPDIPKPDYRIDLYGRVSICQQAPAGVMRSAELCGANRSFSGEYCPPCQASST